MRSGARTPAWTCASPTRTPTPSAGCWCGRRTARSGAGADDPLAGRVDADGFVDTGDLARIDDEGFVWIEGRAGDLINRGGNKVFPDAVEEVLLLHPSVQRRRGGRRAGRSAR